MMLFPQENATGLLPGPAGQLEIAVSYPDKNIPTRDIVFIMCHPNPTMEGTMNNKVVTTTTRTMNRLGLKAVCFNYRGVGQSEGVYGDYEGECEDLAAVVHWVQQQLPDHELYLGGFSFGSYIAYRMANTLGAKRLLSIAPALNYERYADVDEPMMPWDIIVPDADEVVDVQQTFSWLSEVKQSYHLVKMAGVSHFFHRQLIALKQELMRLYSGPAH